MENKKTLPVIGVVCVIYMLCFGLRIGEYFLLRTDQSVVGEAIVHKVAGIAVLVAACRYLRCSRSDIGFSAERAGRHAVYGLLTGAAAYAVAYGAELLILRAQAPVLRFFVTSYTVQGNRAMQGGAVLLVCVLGNIVNVFMEEGVFRGLFVRLVEGRHGFAAACCVSSLLFGLWHITSPLRNWLDGEQSLAGAVMTALMLVITGAVFGLQLCLLLKITGSLWAGMGVHFVNNTVVNVLHVVTGARVDALQAVRISIAQTLLFGVVLAVFVVRRAYRQETFRA